MLFRVRLSNFAAHGVSLQGYAMRPILYVRVDFGGTAHTTEPFEGGMDPIWRYDTTFDYHHSGTVEDLSALRMSVVVMANSGQGAVVGRYTATLFAVATQESTQHVFPLERPNMGDARVSVLMEEVVGASVRLLDLSIDQLPPNVSHDAVCPYLTYSITPHHVSSPCESKVKLSNAHPQWSDIELPAMTFRTTMAQLLSSSLSVQVRHATARLTPNYHDAVIATVVVPIGPLIRCTANHSTRFAAPLQLMFRAGPYESAVRGTLEFLNLPRVVPRLDRWALGEPTRSFTYGGTSPPRERLPGAHARSLASPARETPGGYPSAVARPLVSPPRERAQGYPSAVAATGRTSPTREESYLAPRGALDRPLVSPPRERVRLTPAVAVARGRVALGGPADRDTLSSHPYPSPHVTGEAPRALGYTSPRRWGPVDMPLPLEPTPLPSRPIGGPFEVESPGGPRRREPVALPTNRGDVVAALRALDAEEAAASVELARRRAEFDQQEEELRRVLDKLMPLMQST